MVDIDIVTSRLRDLTLRIQRIRLHCSPTPEELAGNQDALDLVSFNLMLAVQACLDVASHIIADESWEPVTTSADSFQCLEQHSVISMATAKTLALASGLRNVVAHEYAGIRPGLVHKAATDGLAGLEQFAREVGDWMSKRLSA